MINFILLHVSTRNESPSSHLNLLLWPNSDYKWNVNSLRDPIRLYNGYTDKTYMKFIIIYIVAIGEPGSSVGITTGYVLGGPRIESRWERDFPHLSRAALGPTQPPVQWVPGLSGGRKRSGRDVDPSPLVVPRAKNRVELYLYSPQRPSWTVNRVTTTTSCDRQTLPLFYI
jgi:hypothetical protein